MNQTLWIQLFNAGYGAPTYGPVPVFPPTNLVTPQESSATRTPTARRTPWRCSDRTAGRSCPDGTSSCAKPGTKAGECGAGISQGSQAELQLPVLRRGDVVQQPGQRAGLRAGLRQASTLHLSGKSFGDVLTVAASPCAAGKACDWDIANWGGGWVYSPDIYPTGEEIFASGRFAELRPVLRRDRRPADQGDEHLVVAEGAVQLRELPGDAGARHLAARDRPRAQRGRQERLRLHPAEPAVQLDGRELVLLQGPPSRAGYNKDWAAPVTRAGKGHPCPVKGNTGGPRPATARLSAPAPRRPCRGRR